MSHHAKTVAIFLVKVDQDGQLLWEKSYGDTLIDQGYDIVETDDGGFALLGHYMPRYAVDSDFKLIRTDSLGNVLWEKSYGGPYSDYSFSIAKYPDGGFILGGSYSQSQVLNDRYGWVIRTDLNGDTIWTVKLRKAGTGIGYYNTVHGVFVCRNGDIIACGSEITRLDSNGNIIWRKEKWMNTCLETPEGDIMGESTGLIAKMNSTGNVTWERLFFPEFYSTGLIQTEDNGFLMAGYTKPDSSLYLDAHAKKLNCNGLLETDSTCLPPTPLPEPPMPEGITLYPNPASGFVSIVVPNLQDTDHFTFELFDATGKRIFQSNLNGATSEIMLEEMATCLYFYRVTGRKKINHAGKLLIK